MLTVTLFMIVQLKYILCVWHVKTLCVVPRTCCLMLKVKMNPELKTMPRRILMFSLRSFGLMSSVVFWMYKNVLEEHTSSIFRFQVRDGKPVRTLLFLFLSQLWLANLHAFPSPILYLSTHQLPYPSKFNTEYEGSVFLRMFVDSIQ
jgi:hypothetical protein